MSGKNSQVEIFLGIFSFVWGLFNYFEDVFFFSIDWKFAKDFEIFAYIKFDFICWTKIMKKWEIKNLHLLKTGEVGDRGENVDGGDSAND